MAGQNQRSVVGAPLTSPRPVCVALRAPECVFCGSKEFQQAPAVTRNEK